MNNSAKTLLVWLTIFAVFLTMFWFMKQSRERASDLTYDQFLEKVKAGEVGSVIIQGQKIRGRLRAPEAGEAPEFITLGPREADRMLLSLLEENRVRVQFKKEEETSMSQLILAVLPVALIVFFMIYFLRQMQNSGGKALSFGKSRPRFLNESQERVTFEDVAGVEEAKEELAEVIEFLKDPRKFTKLGGRIPKGILLVGPPGTGKTLLARAVAGEAGVPFLSISGSDFVEMFVGVGASRVRDLFLQGKKHAPCIIFIDEIDAVGRHRGAGVGGGHDEREQTLNQLLVEMDGFESHEGVILMAATNRPDVLDPALLRPGRFDRTVVVPRPDVRGRLEILNVHTRKKPLAPDVDLEVLAKGTPGFSGADLENMVNEAALIAARRNKDMIGKDEFEYAKDKVLMGTERRSMVISEEERRLTACHEAGHALAAYLLPGSDPVHKVTIIPRGRALGVTQQLPLEDKYTISKSKALSDMVILYGGRAAEEIALGEQTSGAGNDLERATELARKMVCEWGMSELLGPLTFGQKDEEIFLGKDLIMKKDYSEKTAELIDQEIKRFCTEAKEKAETLLRENRDKLEILASALLERESLDAAEIQLLMEGKELPALHKPSSPAEATPEESPAKARKRKIRREVIPRPDPVGGEI